MYNNNFMGRQPTIEDITSGRICNGCMQIEDYKVFDYHYIEEDKDNDLKFCPHCGACQYDISLGSKKSNPKNLEDALVQQMRLVNIRRDKNIKSGNNVASHISTNPPGGPVISFGNFISRDNMDKGILVNRDIRDTRDTRDDKGAMDIKDIKDDKNKIGELALTLKSLARSFGSITFPDDLTLLDLKHIVGRIESSHHSHYRLIIDGRHIEDHMLTNTLAQFGVKSDSNILFILRLRGS